MKHGDRDALTAAIRYSTSALNVEKDRAVELAANDTAQIQSMRDHNAGFVTVTASRPAVAGGKQSAVARTVTAVMTEKQKTKKQLANRADDERIAREALDL